MSPCEEHLKSVTHLTRSEKYLSDVNKVWSTRVVIFYRTQDFFASYY